MIDKSESSTDWPLVTVRSDDASTASGVLVADDVVFVPHPPAHLLTASKLNVVITSGSADGPRNESTGVTDVRLLGLDDGKVRACLAVLTLAEPSALRRKVPQYSAAKLGEAITDHEGDLWAALSSLGYGVPAVASRDGVPESVPALRSFAGQEGKAAEMHDSIATFADSGCNACGCCHEPKRPPADGGRRP